MYFARILDENLKYVEDWNTFLWQIVEQIFDSVIVKKELEGDSIVALASCVFI